MSDQCCKCGWIGTDDDKVVSETQKHQFLKDLVCPECGNDDFYSPPIKPTARMKRYQQNAELKKVRAELAEAQLQARQWHEAFDRTMADYHTVTEQVAELRAAADLLARVRRECRIDVTETGVEGIGVLIGITITGMDRDGMRELAEALTVGGDGSGKPV